MNDVQIALDNLEQLTAASRARVLNTIVRNIVDQAHNDGALTWDELEATIESACRDIKWD